MRAGGAPQLRQSHLAVTLPGIPSPRGPSFCSALECCRASTLRSLSPQSSLCTCAGYISMCPSHLVLLSSGYITTSPPFPQGNGLEAEQTGRRRRVSHVQRRRKESLFQLQGTRLSRSGKWGEDRIGGVGPQTRRPQGRGQEKDRHGRCSLLTGDSCIVNPSRDLT